MRRLALAVALAAGLSFTATAQDPSKIGPPGDVSALKNYLPIGRPKNLKPSKVPDLSGDWAADMKPVTGTDLCMHAHVGFLAHGEIHIEYADGCVVEHKAPQIIAIDPGHDGWVVGNEPVVMIEFDFERETVKKLGMLKAHRHTPDR